MIRLPRALLGEPTPPHARRPPCLALRGRALPALEVVEGGRARGDPAAHGHAEALFAPLHDLAREERREGTSQQELGLAAPKLEVRGQPAHEVDDLAVEEGGAHLERVAHAGPVHLRQDTVLKIELGEELERAVHQRSAARAVPRLDGLGVDVLGVDRLAQQLGELGGPERGEPDGVPQVRRMVEAGQRAFEAELEAHVAVRGGKP